VITSGHMPFEFSTITECGSSPPMAECTSLFRPATLLSSRWAAVSRLKQPRRKPSENWQDSCRRPTQKERGGDGSSDDASRIRGAGGAGLGVLALGRPVLGADSELIFESSIPSGRPPMSRSNHGYMIFDTLFALDSRSKPQPQMVGDCSISPDKLQYRFALRPGLKFHDGQPVSRCRLRRLAAAVDGTRCTGSGARGYARRDDRR
jgi:hypothetical protein